MGVQILLVNLLSLGRALLWGNLLAFLAIMNCMKYPQSLTYQGGLRNVPLQPGPSLIHVHDTEPRYDQTICVENQSLNTEIVRENSCSSGTNTSKSTLQTSMYTPETQGSGVRINKIHATDGLENCDMTCDENMAHSDTVYRVSQNVDWSETYVTVSQKLKLCSLMDRFDFVFVGLDKKLGECDIILPKIRVDPKHKPIRERYYPLSPKQKLVLEDMILDMEGQGIIQRSSSPWAAPCLLVAKPNNKGYRFVVDYRGINKLIELEAQSLPTTDLRL